MTPGGGDLAVPALSFPFPASLHPAADELEQRTVAWMMSHELARRGREEDFRRRQRLGRVCAWFCPRGETDRVALVCYMTICATLLDDRVTDPAGRTGDLAGLCHRWLVLDSVLGDPYVLGDRYSVPPAGSPAGPAAGPAVEDPLERALRDLWQRIRTVATAGQVARLHEAVLRTCHGFTADAAHAASQRPPTLAEYRLIRPASSVLWVYVVLLEIAGGFELPLAVAQDPQVRALSSAAIEVFNTTHEILTCPRDVRLGDRHNLAVILASERGISVQDALESIAADLRQLTGRFLTLADQLQQRGLDSIPQYVSALKDFIAGHLAWLAETEKYDVSNQDPSPAL